MSTIELGEPIYCVDSFVSNPKRFAFACDSGKTIVQDIETNKTIFSHQSTESVILVSTMENLLYSATENQVFLHDPREPRSSRTLLTSPSEIYDLSASGNVFAVATVLNDIILSDTRCLKKPKSVSVLPAVCSSLQFVDPTHLAAGYIDTCLGIWDLGSRRFEQFAEVVAGLVNPPVVHSVAGNRDFVIAGRQTGLSIYKNGKLIANDLFDHEGPVQAVSMANCFDGRPFSASGSVDGENGTLMILDLEKLEVLTAMEVEGEKIQSICSNSDCVAVADTSDNGKIQFFKREDFANEE
jgi:WD40 repeat protein